MTNIEIRPTEDLVRELVSLGWNAYVYCKPVDIDRGQEPVSKYDNTLFALPVNCWLTREDVLGLFDSERDGLGAWGETKALADAGVLNKLEVMTIESICELWTMNIPCAWSILWRLADEGYIENELMKRDGVYLLTNEAYLLMAHEVNDE